MLFLHQKDVGKNIFGVLQEHRRNIYFINCPNRRNKT